MCLHAPEALVLESANGTVDLFGSMEHPWSQANNTVIESTQRSLITMFVDSDCVCIDHRIKRPTIGHAIFIWTLCIVEHIVVFNVTAPSSYFYKHFSNSNTQSSRTLCTLFLLVTKGTQCINTTCRARWSKTYFIGLSFDPLEFLLIKTLEQRAYKATLHLAKDIVIMLIS